MLETGDGEADGMPDDDLAPPSSAPRDRSEAPSNDDDGGGGSGTPGDTGELQRQAGSYGRDAAQDPSRPHESAHDDEQA